MSNAVVLLSGGLDSATVLAHAQAEGFSVSALTFRYGQRHQAEVESARRVASAFGVTDHVVLDIDLRAFGQSALTDDIPVPKGRSAAEMGAVIPVTYVPARNTIFLSYSLAFAEIRFAYDIFIGVNALDYSGYPDCRPEFISAFQALANLATAQAVRSERPITIHAPLVHKTKGEIVRMGVGLGMDYASTVSCYDASGDGKACGFCDACILRRKGFQDCGLSDPTQYRESNMVA